MASWLVEFVPKGRGKGPRSVIFFADSLEEARPRLDHCYEVNDGNYKCVLKRFGPPEEQPYLDGRHRFIDKHELNRLQGAQWWHVEEVRGGVDDRHGDALKVRRAAHAKRALEQAPS